MRRHRAQLSFETLEDRYCPATAGIDSLGNLRITGSIDNANGGLSVITTAPDTFEVIDGITPIFSGSTSKDVIVASTLADDLVFVDLSGGQMTGSLTVNTGLGDDFVMVIGTGAPNDVGGNITQTGVNHSILLTVALAGNLRIVTQVNSGDNLINDAFVLLSNIGGYFDYYGGNDSDTLGVSQTSIGRHLGAQMRGGFNGITLDAVTTGQYFWYGGTTGDDSVIVDSLTFIGSYVSLQLGDGDNQVHFSGNVARDLTILAGSGFDQILGFTGNVGTNVSINLGNGDNYLEMLGGSLGGTSFSYTGGTGVDTVSFGAGLVATNVAFTVKLGDGDDVLTLDTPLTAWFKMYADFGAGADTLNNNVLAVAPQLTTANLP
jgi:hypothetical protein